MTKRVKSSPRACACCKSHRLVADKGEGVALSSLIRVVRNVAEVCEGENRGRMEGRCCATNIVERNSRESRCGV